MAFIIRRVLAFPLLLLNFGLYIVVVALAGWALDTAIDQTWEAISYNPASFYFVIFSLIAGVVGIASIFSGSHHLRSWHTESFVGTGSAGVIAWLLTLLAMGLAAKEISIGGIISLRMRVLEAIVIVVAITQLIYLLVIGAGLYRGEYIIRTRDAFEVHEAQPTTSKEAPPA